MLAYKGIMELDENKSPYQNIDSRQFFFFFPAFPWLFVLRRILCVAASLGMW